MFVVCETVSWRRGQTATYWPKVLLTIAALLPHLCWVAQPWVTEGPKPTVWSWFSLCWHPISNWLKPSVSWLYFCFTSTCFRLFTQVHLLIDGLVEGQYVTIPIISNQIYLTHRWDHNKYCHPGQSSGNNRVLHTPHRSRTGALAMDVV